MIAAMKKNPPLNVDMEEILKVSQRITLRTLAEAVKDHVWRSCMHFVAGKKALQTFWQLHSR